MFLQELKTLLEAPALPKGFLKQVCQQLEDDAFEASFECDSDDVAEDATEVNVMASASSMAAGIDVKIKLNGKYLNVVFQGRKDSGETAERDSNVPFQGRTPKDVADDIDSIAGSFIHNELDEYDEDDEYD